MNLEPQFYESISCRPSITIIIYNSFCMADISTSTFMTTTNIIAYIQYKMSKRFVFPYLSNWLLAAHRTQCQSGLMPNTTQCITYEKKIAIHATFWVHDIWWNIQIKFSTIHHVSTADVNIWNHFKMQPNTPIYVTP